MGNFRALLPLLRSEFDCGTQLFIIYCYLFHALAPSMGIFSRSLLPFFRFILLFGHIQPLIVTVLPFFPLLRAHSTVNRYRFSVLSSSSGTFNR
ncbi:hypothetical protein H5P36_07020 [Bacillus sp. APMAM]|nr:hypothetical protein [Bacillus sp. APMAM]